MIDTALIEATASRYRKREKQRSRNKLARRGFGKDDVAALVRQSPRGSLAAGRREPLALERVLGTNDLMGVALLERGLQVARSVGRI
jgi:hypothetical protein